MPSMPSGAIALWYGAIIDIPAGWILCNGANGSPDLRNRFIVGAGDTYAPEATGGTTQHAHTFTSDAHAHTISAGMEIGAGANYAAATDPAVTVGNTSNTDNLPPYYALAYIMKT